MFEVGRKACRCPRSYYKFLRWSKLLHSQYTNFAEKNRSILSKHFKGHIAFGNRVARADVAFGSAVAMVDTALLNRQATRASALPTNQQICGDPSRRKKLASMDSLCESERLVLPPLPKNLMLSFLGTPGGIGGFRFYDPEIVSGLVRDCLGIGSVHSRRNVDWNWSGIGSRLSRDFLGNGSVKSETIFGQLLWYIRPTTPC